MRIMLKKLLKKYKYPPEGAEEALNIVMKQCDHWANDENNDNDTPARLYQVQEGGESYGMAAESIE